MAKSRKPPGTLWTHDEMRFAIRLHDAGLSWEQAAASVGHDPRGLPMLAKGFLDRWGIADSPKPHRGAGNDLPSPGILGGIRIAGRSGRVEYLTARRNVTERRAHSEQAGEEPANVYIARLKAYEHWASQAAEAETVHDKPCVVCQKPVDDTLVPCSRCLVWVHDDCQVAHSCPGDPFTAQRYEEPDEWESAPIPLRELEFLPYTRELADAAGPFIGDVGERSSPPVERDGGHRRARRNGVKYGRVAYRCPRCGLEWIPPYRCERERTPVTCPRACTGILPRPMHVNGNGLSTTAS